MREIIQASFGKESNYLQTHFWNFADETLKTRSQALNQKQSDQADDAAMDDERFTAQMQSASVLFYEQASSGQMTPRIIYTDFRDNFGNFSSCFSLEKQNRFDKKQGEASGIMGYEEESKDFRMDMWDGQVQVSEADQRPLSKFHQELIDYDEYQNAQYEDSDKYE